MAFFLLLEKIFIYFMKSTSTIYNYTYIFWRINDTYHQNYESISFMDSLYSLSGQLVPTQNIYSVMYFHKCKLPSIECTTYDIYLVYIDFITCKRCSSQI